MPKKVRWAQKAARKMKKEGTEGSLTKAAHSASYDSPLEYAHHIMSAPEGEYSGKMRKKANFAANVNK